MCTIAGLSLKSSSTSRKFALQVSFEDDCEIGNELVESDGAELPVGTKLGSLSGIALCEGDFQLAVQLEV